MATRYTDVDLMILKRWEEVNALRDAYDDLFDRMRDVVETTLQKSCTALTERGLAADFNPKHPSIWFWKSNWASRSKEYGVCLELRDFVPSDYGRDIGDHPWIGLTTDQFSKLRIRETSEDFGRAVRAALSSELLTKWNHDDADLSESPLGRNCTDLSKLDRVRLVSDPNALGKFVAERLDELAELVPAVDQTLQKMTRR